MKAAMKARDKPRLNTIRLMLADFKRIEVDERIEIDDQRALAVLDKMVKQRRDSAQQFSDADRPELRGPGNTDGGKRLLNERRGQDDGRRGGQSDGEPAADHQESRILPLL